MTSIMSPHIRGSGSVKRKGYGVDPSPQCVEILPKKRTRLQSEQRQFYREQLIRAAEKVFSEKSYGVVSIDDIVSEAGVSRATFYRHFSNKIDIVSLLADSVVDEMISAYSFLKKEKYEGNYILNLINLNISIYENRFSIIKTIREAGASDPSYFESKTKYYHECAIIELGNIFNAFRCAADACDVDIIKIKAHFLIRQLHLFCYDIVISGWKDGREVGKNMISDQFMKFIEEYK